MSPGPAASLPGQLLARCTFPPPGSSVVCGVSGGADSLALLVLAVEAGCGPTAVHVDHGLRAGSSADAEVVRRVADRLDVPVRVERVEVAPGPNLEARARSARHRVLGPDAALGHTADDQAETVLLNMLRGAALDGLAGMRPGTRHPILGLRRAETLSLCQTVGVPWIEDPTNHDPVHRRNRVRHELVPLLESIAERDPVPVLARQAGLVRDVADHVDGQAGLLDPTDTRELAAAPGVVARAALRRWLRQTSPDRHPPAAATLDRVLAVVHGEVVACEIKGGWRVARSSGRLRLERPTAPLEGRAVGSSRPPGDRSRRPRPEPSAAPVGDASSADHDGPSARLGYLRRVPDAAPGGPFRTAPTGPHPYRAPDDDPDLGGVVVTEADLVHRLDELGAEITSDYAGRMPLLVCVLKGAFLFTADLARRIELPAEIDFMAVASYGSTTKTSGVVRIVKDLDRELQGREVIVVEDVVDSGLTLNYLRKNLQARHPLSVEVCALLVKEGAQRVEPDLRYVGFRIPDTFVVGYGLDVDERYRHLRDVRTYVGS